MGGRRGALPARAGSASMPVAVAAGETTLTVTPCPATSAAQLRASAMSAALVAAYCPRPGMPWATRLPMKTTRPRPRAAMAGTRASARRVAASTCRRHMSSPPAWSSWPSGPTRSTPAACTKASGTPDTAGAGVGFGAWALAWRAGPFSAGVWCAGASSSAAAARAMASPSARSAGRCAKAGCAMAGGATSSPVTRQPVASRDSAIARPMPLLLPVTTACGTGPPAFATGAGTDTDTDTDTDGTVASLGTDMALGHDLLGALHVSALELREILRAAGRDEQALLLELGADLGQGLVHFGVEALHERGRGFGRGPEAVPAVELVAGNGFGHGGHVRQVGHALGRGDGHHAQHAALVVLERAEDGVDEAVDLPADQVLEGRRGALVRHDKVVDPAGALEQFGGEMPGGADGADGEGHLPGAGLGVGDQALDVGDGQVLVDRDRERRLRDQGHGDEILRDVVGHGLERHRRRGVRGGAEQQRVAVGRRLGDGVAADHAAAAGLVVHDEGLAHLLAELLRKHAADGVERAARREGDHHPHGLAGVGLRGLRLRRGAGRHRKGGGAQGGAEEVLALHGVLSPVVVSCEATGGGSNAQRWSRPACFTAARSASISFALGASVGGRTVASSITPARYMPPFMRAWASPVGSPPP